MKIKKCICFAICTAIFFSLTQSTFASMIEADYSVADSIVGDIYFEGESNVLIDTEQGAAVLNSEVIADSDSPRSYYATPIVLNNDDSDIFYFTTELKIDATEDLTANRYIKLVWGNGENISDMPGANLINITKNGIKIGAKTFSKNIVNDGSKHRITAMAKLAEKKITVYIDGEFLTEDIAFASTNEIDKSTLRLMYNNYYTKKQVESFSKVYVYSLSAILGAEEKISSVIDNSIISTLDIENGFMLNYGSVVAYEPEISIKRSDMNGDNEEEVSFSSKFNGYSSVINLDKVDIGKKYTIVINNIVYLTGNIIDYKEYIFDLLDENYEKPSVKITSPETGAMVREKSDVTAMWEIAEGSEPIEKTELYVDDCLIDTLSKQTDYTFNISDKTDAFKITVKVYDKLGGVCEDSVYVGIEENTPPEFEINIADGGSYDISDLSNITVCANDDTGIENISILMDGNVLVSEKTESISLPLEGTTLGEHTLYVEVKDIDGAVASSSYDFKLTKSDYVEYVSFDFNSWSEGQTIPGCVYIVPGGFARPVQIDDEHGKSIEFGSTEKLYTENDNAVNTFLQVSTPSSYNIKRATLEFDVMITGEAYINVLTRGFGESDSDVALYMQNLFSNKITYSDKQIDGDFSSWHRMKYDVDIANHKYSWYIQNEAGQYIPCIVNEPISDKLIVLGQQIRLIFSGFYKDFDNSRVILDNIVFKKVLENPSVLSITDDSNETNPSYDTEYLKVQLSSDATGIETKDIEIENELGSIPIKEVSIDKEDSKTIYVYPGSELLSAAKHTLKVKKGAITGDMVMSYDTERTFETAPKLNDIISGEFIVSDKICFTANVVGSNADDEKMTVVLSLYEDGILKKVYSNTVTPTAGKNISVYTDTLPSREYEVYATVINNWEHRVPISNKLFYEKISK